MKTDLEVIIQRFKTCIEDTSYIQGSERGINLSQDQKLTWNVSNSDNLNSTCYAEINSIDDAVTIMNTFSEERQFTREYLRQEFVPNWTKPTFLHLYKSLQAF